MDFVKVRGGELVTADLLKQQVLHNMDLGGSSVRVTSTSASYRGRFLHEVLIHF